MIKKLSDIKLQTCNICDAMLRNMNDNFKSVSFDYFNHGDIQLKIILKAKTEIEDDYIEDMVTEFSALQQFNIVLKPQIMIGNEHKPLKYLVYQED